MSRSNSNRIVLAYSGGLDTTVIIPWLRENYDNPEILAVCTDVGQKEEWEKLEERAIRAGASSFHVCDIREEFAAEYLGAIVRGGAIYEGKYLLGTAIARPIQAKHIVEVALREGADTIAHGCTGKGNDQVRFELTFKALAPHLKVIAPWRLWDISSREDAIRYAEDRELDLGEISASNIFSRDWNLWHMSHEGGTLEDPWDRPEEEMFLLSKSPMSAPDQESEVTIDFENGVAVGLDGKHLCASELLTTLNTLGGENGIGREDIMETRVVGMKVRGVYETPGGAILMKAIRELEMLTLDGETLSLKNQLSIRYAELVYSGKWFSPAREALDAFMSKAMEYTTGSVRVGLYKGNITILGRKSPYSLYLEDLASFGESSYDHGSASGFIDLYGLSTGVTAMVRRRITPAEGQAPAMLGTAATYKEK